MVDDSAHIDIHSLSLTITLAEDPCRQCKKHRMLVLNQGNSKHRQEDMGVLGRKESVLSTLAKIEELLSDSPTRKQKLQVYVGKHLPSNHCSLTHLLFCAQATHFPTYLCLCNCIQPWPKQPLLNTCRN